MVELRYIRTRNKQLDILKACHIDPTAGHFGVKKTIAHISERFLLTGIVKDTKEMLIANECAFLCY